MKSNTDLLAWASGWNWPCLVIDPAHGTIIPAGEENWRAFVARKDRKGKLQAWQRIHLWNERAETTEEKTA